MSLIHIRLSTFDINYRLSFLKDGSSNSPTSVAWSVCRTLVLGLAIAARPDPVTEFKVHQKRAIFSPWMQVSGTLMACAG